MYSGALYQVRATANERGYRENKVQIMGNAYSGYEVLDISPTPRIRFCTGCVTSSMRPRITFDAEGVCSACRFAEFKATVDWAQRESELAQLCARFRRGGGSFDVIVPVSGGKDGGFVAHKLKHDYGMTPL